MDIVDKILAKLMEVGFLISIIVFAFDFVPVFATWLRRIHIGRYAEEGVWRAAAEKRAKKWIKKMPQIAVTDRTAYTIVPRLKGAYSNRKFECWQEASLLLGLAGDKEAAAAARRFFDETGVGEKPYTVGNAMLLYSLLCNGFENDEKVRAAADKYCKTMLDLAGEGTLPYNPNSTHRFVDTLGMACPFLVKYHTTYGCPEALELVKRQLAEYYEFGIHPVTGLPVHCFCTKTKAPLGIYNWGRGSGWLAIALADCYEQLEGKDEYADILKEKIRDFAVSLSRVQCADGSFNSALGAGSHADSSATAMLSWFLSRAANIFGSEQLEARAQEGKKYLMSITRRNGEVDFAQGDTMGAGNYSRRFEPLPAAQGFALRIGK